MFLHARQDRKCEISVKEHEVNDNKQNSIQYEPIYGTEDGEMVSERENKRKERGAERTKE